MRVCLLGPIEIVNAGREVRLSRPRERVLIAALASEAGKVISAGRLIDTIWGDQPPRSARVKLQGHVSSLRKVLADSDRDVISGRWPLITREPGYLLSADGVSVDLLEYRALLKSAAGALEAQDFISASALLADALALWRGPAFADAQTPILASVAIALERGRMLAMERKAVCDLKVGRYEAVVEQLTSILAEHPHREGVRAGLMMALYRVGWRAEALECYRSGRQLLRQQLGIEPGVHLRRLHEMMLIDDPRLADVEAVASYDRTGARPLPPAV